MWRPTAEIETLKKRAALLGNCRSFFLQRGIQETDVPVIGRTGVSDPNIECFRCENLSLQSSPEYYMKRLLAAGSGDIYYLGKAFRKEEEGVRHSSEFTLLEWYRLGFDEYQLASEVVDLICHVAAENVPTIQKTYADFFIASAGLNPHIASVEELAELARSRLDIHFDLPNKSAWLDLLFTHLVEPAMGNNLCVVYEYPACQSALARKTVNFQGYEVARRFEVYWRGLELANGYWELCDACEQLARFEQDLAVREVEGKLPVEIDNNLMAALEHGLPSCAGVALGVDRLLMCLTGESDIKAVQFFSPLD